MAQTNHDLMAAPLLEELAACALELGDFAAVAPQMITGIDSRERHFEAGEEHVPGFWFGLALQTRAM